MTALSSTTTSPLARRLVVSLFLLLQTCRRRHPVVIRAFQIGGLAVARSTHNRRRSVVDDANPFGFSSASSSFRLVTMTMAATTRRKGGGDSSPSLKMAAPSMRRKNNASSSSSPPPRRRAEKQQRPLDGAIIVSGKEQQPTMAGTATTIDTKKKKRNSTRAAPPAVTPAAFSSSSPHRKTIQQTPPPPDTASSSASRSSFSDSSAPGMTTTSTTMMINLSTVSLEDLRALIVDAWGYPTFRANQVYDWIRHHGVTDAHHMTNVPLALREQLGNICRPHALELVDEWINKDGTVLERTYRCSGGGGVDDRHENNIIESVLMGPYQDGRYTACISSQAAGTDALQRYNRFFGATGQIMDFTRQLLLTADEIVEQVARFQSHLQSQPKQHGLMSQLINANDQDEDEEKEQERRPRKRPASTTTATATSTTTSIPRLSNVVLFMGMDEPLANYNNIKLAIRRITTELGIGARKVTISTVGSIPSMMMIRQLAHDEEMPPVKLAVSLLHGTDDDDTQQRTKLLLPANGRSGGLIELFDALREYMRVTNRRITIEWTLIRGENDGPATARQLGRLLRDQLDRPDLVHVNVIPLNPTRNNDGRPSSTAVIDAFCNILIDDYKIPCTPRWLRTAQSVRPGGGEGATRTTVRAAAATRSFDESLTMATHDDGVDMVDMDMDDGEYDGEYDEYDDEFAADDDTEAFESAEDRAEAQRLIALVENTKIDLSALSIIGKKK